MVRGFKDEEDRLIERFLNYELESRTFEDILEELGCSVFDAFKVLRENGLLDEEQLGIYLEGL